MRKIAAGRASRDLTGLPLGSLSVSPSPPWRIIVRTTMSESSVGVCWCILVYFCVIYTRPARGMDLRGNADGEARSQDLGERDSRVPARCNGHDVSSNVNRRREDRVVALVSQECWQDSHATDPGNASRPGCELECLVRVTRAHISSPSCALGNRMDRLHSPVQV